MEDETNPNETAVEIAETVAEIAEERIEAAEARAEAAEAVTIAVVEAAVETEENRQREEFANAMRAENEILRNEVAECRLRMSEMGEAISTLAASQLEMTATLETLLTLPQSNRPSDAEDRLEAENPPEAAEASPPGVEGQPDKPPAELPTPKRRRILL